MFKNKKFMFNLKKVSDVSLIYLENKLKLNLFASSPIVLQLEGDKYLLPACPFNASQ